MDRPSAVHGEVQMILLPLNIVIKLLRVLVALGVVTLIILAVLK